MREEAWIHVTTDRLIDGTGTNARPADVLVRAGKVIEVGGRGSITPPRDAVTIDAADSTVIPGLIDPHFHATYSGHIGMQQLEWPQSLEDSAVRAGPNATRALWCGYTSVLDVGCRGRIGVAVRAAIRDGVVQGPTMRVSGQIISTVGGPLDLWPSSMRLDPATRLVALVSGVEHIRRVIREQAKDGTDNVKMQISSSAVQRNARRACVFEDDELLAASETAHSLGLSIAAHAEGPEAVGAAIRAGFDTIHHASFVDHATLSLLETNPRSALIFTLGVYDDIRHRGAAINYPRASIERIDAVWDKMVAAVRLAYERGVPFAVGSDTGGAVHPHGRYAHDIALLVNAVGLSTEHAIRAATLHAARAGWFANVGTLTPGADADLVVVIGDLTKRIELLEDEVNVRVVAKKGRVVKGASLTGAGERVFA